MSHFKMIFHNNKPHCVSGAPGAGIVAHRRESRPIILYFLLTLSLLWLSGVVAAQKKLSEATIYYDVVISTNNDKPKAADMLDGATNIIYLKGNLSRSDFISSLGTQSTIYDAKTGTATNIKDYGDKKFMITYTAAEWKADNKKYEGLTYTIENEFKEIAGYKCQKATAKLADGSVITVYFSRDLILLNSDFQYINKNLPGLALQYQATRGDARVTYTVSNIEFTVIPLAKFDLPKTGYRVMSYSTFSKNLPKN
ncbi:hypothetical protein [Niabella terrae]